MSAASLRSPSDLDQFIQDNQSTARIVAAGHDARRDLSAALLNAAARARQDGRPVRLIAPDGPAARRWADAFERAQMPASWVVSARTAALGVIAAAADELPRDARLLDGNEMDVLMEDMKVSGLKLGRLREMTKFLFKGIADGTSRTDGWLINGEERRIWALLRDNLDARRALLPGEAYTVALDALETEAGREAAEALVPGGCLLIVPDFSSLSGSAQMFIDALDAACLLASAPNLDASNSEEPYPHPAGFRKLCELRDAAAGEIAEADEAAQQVVSAETPADEFAAVAQRAADACAAGARAKDILIACPNRIWMEQIASRLQDRGLPCVIEADTRKAKGDPRDERRCGALRTRALAKLLRDPDDFTALRSWLGLGDWLMASDAFLKVREYAQARAITVGEACAELLALPRDHPDRHPLIEKLDGPATALEHLRKSLETASNSEAVRLLQAAGCVLSEAEAQALDNDEPFDAALFSAQVLAEPGEKAGDEAVRITSYHRVFGQHAPIVIACGLVSGFLPLPDASSDKETLDHQKRALNRDRILFEAVKSAARDELVLSHFAKDRLENAQGLSMDIEKISLEDGQRIAHVIASPYLADPAPAPSLTAIETRVSGLATL